MKNIIGTLTTVLCFVFLGTTVYFFISKRQMEERWNAAQEEVTRITIEKTGVEKNLAETTQEKNRITGLYEERTKEADRLKINLATEKSSRERVESELSDTKNRLESITTKLEQAQKENIRLNNQIAETKAEHIRILTELNTKLNKERLLKEETMLQLAEVRLAKDGFEKKVRQVIGEIGLQMAGTPSVTDKGDIIVRTVEGQVVGINREFLFVVLNIGASQGVRLGEVATVLRGDRLIAEVQVKKIREDGSAASILQEYGRQQIKIGDRVRISKVL
jgi:hypothetical protein